MALLDSLWVLFMMCVYMLRSWALWIIPPRKKSVTGETVLITGAGSGIGQLMAVEFAKRGAVLVLWDINKTGNEATARLVREVGARAHTYTCDISKNEEVYNTADKVRQEVGEVSILVNNAGIVSGTKLLETPDAKIKKTLEVNSMGHVWTLKSFLPDMIKNNHGHVVTIASIAGYFGAPGMADYCMSKFAAVGLHESVEREVIIAGAKNVNFTIINPYLINTGMFKGVKVKHPEVLPGMKPEFVVERIMHAVLTNQRVMMIPRLLYVMCYLKTILPAESQFLEPEEVDFAGFIGRSQPKSNKDD